MKLTPHQMQELSEEFDDMCQKRHAMGQEKYGPTSFLERDTMGDIFEELADAANYLRYMYVKLRLIESAYNGPEPQLLGPTAFKSRKKEE